MIQFKTLHLEHAPRLAQIANNKKIWLNLRDIFPYPYHLTDAENFINFLQTQNPTNNFGIFVDGILAGVCGIVPQSDIFRHSAEIGYWLGEEYWGKGIATHIVDFLCKTAFETRNFLKIYAGVIEFNKASMKVLEKNHFVLEGIMKKAILKDGVLYDNYSYGLYYEDWINQR